MKRVVIALTLVAACNGSSSEPAPLPKTNVVTQAVAWPAESSVDTRAFETLGDARSQVTRSPVPVLVPPSDLRRDRTPTLIVEASFYAVTLHSGGATINVQGTRVAHVYEGIDPHPGNRELRAGRGFVTENEGIRAASFVENGVAYSVDVECEDRHDDRCTSDAFVTDIVNRLAYVGGSGR